MEVREITSLQNSIIKHLVRLRQNHDFRVEHNTIVISGIKQVREVCAHTHVRTLLVYDETFIPKNLRPDVVYIVNEEIMQKASGLLNPEGILAEVEMPKASDLKGLKKIVALDRVSDPGNLGSILRTALALGWDGAFILEDSCDPYNDKALSAARGATFRLPIGRGDWKDLQNLIEQNELMSFVGDIKGIPLDEVNPTDKTLIVLSNEAHGVSNQAAKMCQKVTIPMDTEMESLNVSVAGGILMYALQGS